MFCLPLGKRSSKQAVQNYDDGLIERSSATAVEKGSWVSQQTQAEPCAAKQASASCHVTAALTSDEAASRLSKLRGAMTEHKIDYYIIPSEDEHQSEWTAETDQRRKYISGFTGSAGVAIVGREAGEAWLFVDNRYWVQAEKQVSRDWKVVRLQPRDSGGAWSPWQWNLENLTEGARLAIDPKLIAWAAAQPMQALLKARNIHLLGITSNLIDEIRSSTPLQSDSLVELHPVQFSGQSTSSKLKEIRQALFDNQSTSRIYVLPVLPAIAWLLNLRCQGDIPNVPVFRSYLILTPDRCALFISPRKVDKSVKAALEGDGVELMPYGVAEVEKWVKKYREDGKDEKEKAARDKVHVSSTLSWALADSLGLDKIRIIPCPVDKAKGTKNAVELEGFRRGYLRDGVATVRWMAWLEHEIKHKKRSIGEWEAGEKLTEFRSHEQYFKGLAYENISASGPNGALPHYIPVKGADRIIDTDTPYVIDAGAQYLDATIDTTRTMHFGTPTPDQKRAFTRVLQGHIAVETTPFPRGQKGDKLDILARQYLFQDGLNYGHGTGHGLGQYLSVHEYPPSIGGPSFTLEEGQITSNEPGFYLEGSWGIRIESVIACKKVKTMYSFGPSDWLGWERITRVPIQSSLVDFSLLSKEQAHWLREHNKLCRDEIMPLLNAKGDKMVRKWLKEQI